MGDAAARLAKLEEGYVKRIHVDQNKIRAGERDPITIQTSDGSLKAAEVLIDGSSAILYSPTPLSCGARVWIETHSRVTLDWESRKRIEDGD